MLDPSKLKVTYDGVEQRNYWVLFPMGDPAAVKALKVYAETTNDAFVKEVLLEWVREFEEFSCKYPTRPYCNYVGSPVCCAHCTEIQQCLENNGPMCDLVRTGEVADISECK